MRILLADDEELALDVLKRTVQEVVPDGEIVTASDGEEALQAAKEKMPDVAFLDIEMPGINGISLCRKLKEMNTKMNIIFVTAYSQYAVKASRTYFSGYFLKPVTKEMVREAMENLRFPIKKTISGLHVRCFGRFEVFYDGIPVRFSRSGTKEVFAYLVHLRGSTANTDKLCEILWPDKTAGVKERSYLRHLLSDLQQTLKKYQVENVFIKERNAFSVNVEALSCDLFSFFDGEPEAVNQYNGEYMEQYDWAVLE